MARATRALIPIVTEQRAGASTLGAAALLLLLIPPFIADGRQILFWSDLALVALAVLVAVWLRRQRKNAADAPPAPGSAVFASDRRVLRREAMWGVPYLLFVLVGVTALPDLFGLGFACAVIAIALALNARLLARLERSRGGRLYRQPGRGWFRIKRDNIYRVVITHSPPAHGSSARLVHDDQAHRPTL